MTGCNRAPQTAAREHKGGGDDHKESPKIMSLSVFIGVHRWLKNVFHHRHTPMNTDKSLMGDPGNRLLWPFTSIAEVTP